MRMRFRLASLLRPLLALLVVLGFSQTAEAWEIKMTSDGTPIRWPDGKLKIDLNFSAELYEIAQADAEDEARAAFASWGTMLGSHVTVSIKTADSELETGRDGHNTVHWGTDEEDSFIDPVALGTTYLTYRTGTGEILEADIVINGVHYDWTVANGDCSGRYDLQNILAHEAGHLFGIAHSVDHDESTMYPSAGMCETKKRELSPDDQDAIIFLYESISLEAGGSLTEDLIGCSAGGSESGFWGTLLVLLLAGGLRSGRRIAVGALTAALLLPLAVLPLTAEASTLFALEPAELVAQADLVVQGTVVSQKVVLKNGYPTTVSTLAVTRCADTSCPATVVVSQLGGEVGGIGLLVSGVHHLEVGRELLVFLRVTKAGFQPVGRSQGVFEVVRSSEAPVLVRDMRGAVLTRSGRAVHGARTVMSWSQFDRLFGPKLLKTHTP